ncbi:MAG TPA: HAMP domain-containing sensor histidine kinase [Bacillota bacterium]|nr:HAMP domain-containing sensor histidine kinase [Bacillota bacterium]
MVVLSYLVISTILWIVACILIKKAGKNKLIFWYSMYVITAATGALASSIDKEIIPFLTDHYNEAWALWLSGLIARSSSTFSFYIGPLAVFETTRRHALMEESKLTLGIKYIYIAFLSLLTLFNFLTGESFIHIFLDYSRFFKLYCVVGLSVSGIGLSILVESYFSEQLPVIRRKRLLIIAVIVPITVVLLYITYIMPILGWKPVFRRYPAFGVLSALLFLICMVRYIIATIKVQVESQCYDQNIKTANTGIALFNHALKNELQEINLCMENLKKHRNIDRLDYYTKIVLESTDRLASLAQQIQQETQELALEVITCNLSEVVSKSIGHLQPIFEFNHVTVKSDLPGNCLVKIDPAHIQEVCQCIFRNAIEAMESGGEIIVKIDAEAKEVRLVIEDNGPGIPNHLLSKIIQPYFTTKRSQSNFGLGLTYCQNVLRKHKGYLVIKSKEGSGTQVNLFFPQIRKSKLSRFLQGT